MIQAKRTVFDAVLYWVKANVGAWFTRLYGLPYLRVQYEEFVANPSEVVKRVAAFATTHGMEILEDLDSVVALSRVEVPIRNRHLIGANPGVKAQRDFIKLRQDDAWRGQMPVMKKALVTLLVLPLLIWLRYPLWPRQRPVTSGQ